MIILTFLRVLREVFAEVQEMRRVAAARYPFVSDWE
jgi:hypothetical protein